MNTFMDTRTKQLLARWQSLERGEGLRRANTTARVLWFLGLGLCISVIFGIVLRWHPAAVAVLAAVLGWTVAEGNAIRTRLAQWPVFKAYIDWKRIQEDWKE